MRTKYTVNSILPTLYFKIPNLFIFFKLMINLIFSLLDMLMI